MPLYAGWDTSGPTASVRRPRGRDIYVSCVVMMDDPQQLTEAFRRVRSQCGMASADELRGHRVPPRVQLAALEAVVEMDVRVGALIYDKGAMRLQGESLPSPSHFHRVAASALLEQILPIYPISRLLCDEEIQGEEQRTFITEIKRINRQLQPQVRLSIGFKRSRSSDILQLADITAYGLLRLTRGTIELPELQSRLEAIRDHPQNIILGVPAQDRNVEDGGK